MRVLLFMFVLYACMKETGNLYEIQQEKSHGKESTWTI
jgi:hypothetical protein